MNKAYQEPLSVRRESLQVYKHALGLSVNTIGERNSHLRIGDSLTKDYKGLTPTLS